GGSTGGGVTVLLSDVPGGEKTPPGSLLPGCPPPALACSSAACALEPPSPVRYAAMPRPRPRPRPTYSGTFQLNRMVVGSLLNNEWGTRSVDAPFVPGRTSEGYWTLVQYGHRMSGVQCAAMKNGGHEPFVPSTSEPRTQSRNFGRGKASWPFT